MKYLVSLLFIFIVVIASSGFSLAQSKVILNKDSLYKALNKANTEKEKAAIKYHIAKAFSYENNFDSSIKYNASSLAYYKQVDNAEMMCRICFNTANDYIQLKQTAKGIEYLKMAEDYAQKISANSFLKKIYYSFGYVHYNLGNVAEALQYSNKLLQIAEDGNDENTIGQAYQCMGLTYGIGGEQAKSLPYFHKALYYFHKANKKEGAINVKLNIGEYYLTNRNLDSASNYLQTALNDAILIGDKRKEVNILKSFMLLYQYKKDTVNMNKTIERGIKLAEELGDESFRTSFSIWKYIAQLHTIIQMDSTNTPKLETGRQKELAELTSLLQRDLEINKQSFFNLSEVATAHYLLAISYRLLGYNEKAYENLTDYISYKDSFTNLEKTKKFSDIEKKLALQLSNEKIKRADFMKNVSFVGILLLFVITAAALYAYLQKKKDNKIIETSKKKTDELLLNILPGEVAEELKQKGESKAQRYDEVSVLFTDFVNFTKISEQLGVEELLNELNINFTAFDKIMEKYGLEKIKTIGDAYLAVCGLPVNDERHAQNTVKAALDILEFVQKRKQEVPYGLDIRIGINSGPLIAGIIGVKKFAYDIWGDTVNTAARMEQNSQPGKINISEKTYGLVKDEFSCIHRGKLSAKGKGEIDMYFVERSETLKT